LQASILRTTSTTASSTFANGINLTGGCFAQNGLCVENFDPSGITFLYPFPNNATSTQITFTGGFITTNASATNFIATSTLGVGTSTPGTPLGVTGNGVFTGVVTALSFNSTSTTATSSFAAGLQASIFNTTSSTASSTFANGINLTNGCFAQSGTCIKNTDVSGFNFAYPFPNNATSTQLTFTGGFITTNASSTNFVATSSIGIGTSTPGVALGVIGAGVFTSGVTAQYFNATSTTATSTFAAGLQTALLNVTSSTASST